MGRSAEGFSHETFAWVADNIVFSLGACRSRAAKS